MADTGKVIVYSADISDIIRKLQEIEAGTRKTATAINKDFTINSKAAGEGIASIASTTKTVFDKQTKTWKEVTDETAKFSQNVQVADNEFGKFNQTLKTNADGTKSVSTSFRELSESQARAAGLIDPLIGKSSQLATNFDKVSDVNQKFAKELEKIGPASTIVKSGLVSVSGDTEKWSALIATSNGRLLELNETTTKTPQGLKEVSRSVKDVTGQYEPLNRGTKEVDKNTVSLGENISRLAKRALLTIPIWMALRGAIMGFTRTVSEGIKTLGEQDKAFKKAERNLQATTANTGELAFQMGKLRSKTLELSLKTGKSVEELTHTFQRFATVGFSAEASFAGMEFAAKLATVEFGNARETADAFARSMRVLVDTSAGAKSEAQQIAEAMALTDQLWQTNAFEIQEFTHNLTSFAGTAKIANLSVRDTITLLATLSTGGLANRAGRLLRTTILKALQDLDKVSSTLNLNINPNVDSTFDVIMKLVGGLEELSKTQKVPQELAETLGELFSIRSVEVIGALRALKTTLVENAKVVPDIQKLNKAFEDVTASTGVLQDKIKTANQELGKAFVVGLTGGENFNKVLKSINKTQISLIDDMEILGNVIRNAFLVSGIASIIAYRKELIKTINFIKSNQIVLGAVAGFIVLNFKEEANRLERESKVLLDEITKIQSEVARKIQKGFKGELPATELKDLILQLETFGGEKLGIDIGTLDRVLDNLRQRLILEEQIAIVNQKQEQDLSKQIITRNLLSEHVIEQLRNQGALNSEILKTQKLLNEENKISESFEDRLSRQLEIQRELSKEKELQNRFSSTATKLFDVAKESGADVAKKISEVLAGEVDFSIFVRRGGEAVDILKEKFEDFYKTKQMEAFYRGERVPGEEDLRRGVGITLPEIDKLLVTPINEIIAKEKQQAESVAYRLEIEEKITQLRQAELLRSQQAWETWRNKVAIPVTTDGFVSSQFERPIPGAFTNRIEGGVSLNLEAGAIQLSITAGTAKELNEKLDRLMDNVKQEIKDELFGKQTNVF